LVEDFVRLGGHLETLLAPGIQDPLHATDDTLLLINYLAKSLF